MTHTYQIYGMTCGSCEAKVKEALLQVAHIIEVNIALDDNTATVTMDKHISLETLQKALPGQYKISTLEVPDTLLNPQSWFDTYKPIVLIFFYITGITVLVQMSKHSFDVMEAMRHFMAGFFLVFSFFKMMNLRGFSESYVMYDVIAKRFPAWAYLYAFTELALGIAFLVNFNPLITNTVTFVVMSISIIGVLQSVLNKKKIQCACLGAVFNLPMSTVTIIEDALMIVMSGVMILSIG